MRATELRMRMRRYRDAAVESRRTGRDVDEIFGAGEEQRRAAFERSADEMSRRTFLRRGAMVGAAVAGAGTLASLGPYVSRASGATPKVVVVGGGNAGTTAAYRIARLRGWAPQVYEATARIGGRCRSITGLSGGNYAEAGGGGISTRESTIIALAKEVGLAPLVDTWKNYPGGGEIYVFNGQRYTWSQLSAQSNANYEVCWKKWVAIGKKIPTYTNATSAARRYDAMSAATFLNTECPYGTGTAAGQLMATWFGVDYGGRATDASAIHLILEEGSIWGGGGWDERYAIPGGNEKLAQALAARLAPGSVHLGHALVALRRNTDGRYTLTFDDGGGLVDVAADRVVLAIPPPVLDTVDLSQAGFSSVMMRAIQNEKLGSNAKYNVQFTGSPWKARGDSGDGTTDIGLGEFWQANFQTANLGTLIGMNNLDYGNVAAHGVAPQSVRDQLVSQISTLWPGASSSFIAGQAYLDYWPNDPWAKGSYSYYPPNGFTTFGGVQPKRQGNVHFAGEHTANYIDRGFMNGAVRSGERAAREVVGY